MDRETEFKTCGVIIERSLSQAELYFEHVSLFLSSGHLRPKFSESSQPYSDWQCIGSRNLFSVRWLKLE